MKIEISVIIPVYNEQANIGRLLKALSRQDFDRDYEVIVVDNGSEDDTLEIAKKFGVRIIEMGRACNISGLRNAGARNAKGEILAFIDADCLPPKSWLSDGYRMLKNNARIGITGGQFVCPNKATWVQKAWVSTRGKGRRKVNLISSGNLFIRKHTFQVVGGFDANLITGEDYDLCQKVSKKYQIVFDDSLCVTHLRGPATLFQRLRKEIWYGRDMDKILKQKPFYLPFWASLVFLLALTFTLFSVLIGNMRLFLSAIWIIVFEVGCITAIRCWRGANYQYFFHLMLINTFYLAGRSIALITLISKYLRNYW